MNLLKRHTPSPAMIVALIALFVALGGAAYAGVTLSKNSVKSATIKNGEVKTVDLANSAVTNAKLKNNAVNSAKIKDGSIQPSDLAPTAKDASSVGGLTVAQIVAAAGGKYQEARQAAGDVDIKTLTDKSLVTLNLPEAGKYLVTARMPVSCTYDGSDGATPADPSPTQPFFLAKAKLFVGGTLTDTITQSCEAEAGFVAVVAGVWLGKNTVEITRQIEVSGPTTVELRGLAETSVVLFVTAPASSRVNAAASGSIIQAISVRT